MIKEAQEILWEEEGDSVLQNSNIINLLSDALYLFPSLPAPFFRFGGFFSKEEKDKAPCMHKRKERKKRPSKRKERAKTFVDFISIIL